MKTLIDVLEKLLLPALGVLAWTANQASVRVSASQLELAKAQDARQARESQSAAQLKYLEIFYRDINSTDERSQLFALSLLTHLNPELGSSLADLVKTSPRSSKTVADRAASIKTGLDAFGSLSGFKIGIYWDQKSATLAAAARDIKGKIEGRNFPGVVQLYPRSPEFLLSLGASEQNEIRFEAGSEDEAADRLLALMNELTPDRRFVKRDVVNRTPKFMSLFLH
jgi:hypothetical protein